MITNKYSRDQIYLAAKDWYEAKIVADYSTSYPEELQAIAARHSEIALNMMKQDMQKPSLMIAHITSSYLEEQAVLQEYMVRLISNRIESQFLPK